MICVLTLFGETDLQPVLKKIFAQNDIYFIEENCNTSVQLTSQLEKHSKETDAVVIYANAMNMDAINEYVCELRSYVEHLRIILILNGNQNQYLRSLINDYREMKLDLIFDDNGFNAEDLLELVKKGKLSHRDFKQRKKESGFVGDIDEVKPVPEGGAKRHVRKKEGISGASFAEEHDRVEDIRSFSEPSGHYTIGILNAARGAGATGTANNLARFFAMQNYKTCIADLSGTGAVGMMKMRNVEGYTENVDIGELSREYNITVIDFGTPIEIAPDGHNFKLTQIYGPEMIRKFTGCDIKLIMGFSDPWNIEKINFFFTNDTWHKQFDSSYLFIVPSNAGKVKKLYPEGNIFNRTDDFREMILELFRREED